MHDGKDRTGLDDSLHTGVLGSLDDVAAAFVFEVQSLSQRVSPPPQPGCLPIEGRLNTLRGWFEAKLQPSKPLAPP